ncbi:MAG: class I SAM-dependent methyltransferase [Thermoanaerobaculia bacterium]
MTSPPPSWLPAPEALRERFGRTAFYSRYKVVLARCLAERLPERGACRLLDVGTGDGELGRVLALRPMTTVVGVETHVRRSHRPAVPAAVFDGRRLPFADDTFDVALVCDVLHHALDQEALFSEVLRVTRSMVLVKDHVFSCSRERLLLHALDLAGNARFGVRVPARYLDETGWARLFARHPEATVETIRPLPLRGGSMAVLFPVRLELLHVLTKRQG